MRRARQPASDPARKSPPAAACLATKAPPKQKVLLVSLFHPELVRGGAQQICYELFQGLKESHDIEPVLLASIDSSLPALFKSGARITGFDGRDNEFLLLSRDYDYAWHKSSNPQVIEAFAEFLALIRPDVVHFHHFMTIGVDLLTLTRRVLPHCRIVLTFHEFLAICEAHGHMVRSTDRSLCTQASAVRCHQCFPDRAPETFFVRKLWMQAHLQAVDVFTVPSRFMIKHYADWGLDPARIVHVSNGQRNYNLGQVTEQTRARRNRFGFFGQLVDAKGVWVLLRAVALLRAEGFTDFVVEINGDNLRYASEERRAELEAFRASEEALPPDQQNVLFNGSYHTDALPQLMARVDWCVVPSVWWEIFGLVISEAWMFRRPVIVSNVGGMAERVQHEVGGLQFAMGDARSLADTMRRAASEKGLWERLVASLPEPPARDDMVREFAELYARPADALQLEPAD